MSERTVNLLKSSLPLATIGALLLIAFACGAGWTAHALAIDELTKRQEKTTSTVETLIKIVDRLSWIEEQREKRSNLKTRKEETHED